GHRAPHPLDLLLEEARGRLEQPGARPRLRDEGPLPLAPADQPFLLEPGERLADRRPREAEVAAELRLGWEAVARVPASVDDLVLEQLRELEVERDRRVAVDPALGEVHGADTSAGSAASLTGASAAKRRSTFSVIRETALS